MGVNTADGAEAFSSPVTVGFLTSGYLAWVAGIWGDPQNYNPAIQGPSADPDGDGVNNFLERAFPPIRSQELSTDNRRVNFGRKTANAI